MRTLVTLLFAALGLAFIACLGIDLSFTGRWALKAAPIWLLAWVAWRNIPGRYGLLITLGVLASSAGDIFLELDREAYFVHGLGSFLVAHLFYIGAFSLGLRAPRRKLPYAAIVVGYGVLLSAMLVPRLVGTPLLVPVLAYMVVILVMAVMAILRTRHDYRVLFGAVSFVVSDSLIAINQFLGTAPGVAYLPQPGGAIAVMVTYYLAQYLIVMGSLRQDHLRL